MNKEKLELKHLASYLTHKLRMIKKNDWHKEDWSQFEIVELKQLSMPTEDFGEKFDWFSIGAWFLDDKSRYCNYESYQFKPIFRPLSDLIIEKEINGKKIIPLVELAKMEFPNFKETITLSPPPETDYHYCILFKTNVGEIKFSLGFYNKNGLESLFSMECESEGKIHKMFSRYDIQQQLLKWHFDVFGLIDKGLAIDINTLEK